MSFVGCVRSMGRRLMNVTFGIEKLVETTLKAFASAPKSASSQRGESPLQENALRPVTECNCDAAMRGGEQQEVNYQSEE